MRGAIVRSLAVLGLGAAVLASILYYASTVDGRPPAVLRIALTQHLSSDAGVALTTSSIEVRFSELVDQTGAQGAFVLEPAVQGSFSWSGTVMTFTPSDRLALSTHYRALVGAGVRDFVGNAMSQPSADYHFQTVGNPFVVEADPANGASAVALDASVTITFSTLMDTAAVERVLTVTPSTGMRLKWAGERLVLEPLTSLIASRHYLVAIGQDARDQAGTPLAASYLLAFDTVQSGLTATTMMPAAGVEGVAVRTPIAVLFDRPIDPGSVSGDLLTITPSVAGSLEAIESPGAAGLVTPDLRMLRFQPSGALAPNTTYEVHLATGIRAADGSRLADDLTWTFTTGAPRATLSNQIVFLSARSGITNLWAMNPDGTNERQLSAELSAVIDYAVAPDGRSFVVGDGAVLVRSSTDGEDRQVLTEEGLLEYDPAFSPDGSQMAFGRAELATGSGQGLWTRPTTGGDARRLTIPTVGASASNAPSPSPSSGASGFFNPVPLLRAPRYSPDGTRLAYVEAGAVQLLELASGRQQTVRLDAVSPPVWVADSGSLVITDLPGGGGAVIPLGLPRAPVPSLSPTGLALGPTDLMALRVVRVAADGRAVATLPFGPGAALPAIDASGRFAYLKLEAPFGTGGRLWVTTVGGGTSSEVLRDDLLRVTSASFAPQPGSLLVARESLLPSGLGVSAGIWVVDISSGRSSRLSDEGWMPRWLP